MERCPNCGAPARPGAKFCTTCGYRLPVTVPVTSSSDSGETASTAAASWPSPPEQSTESATLDEAPDHAASSDAPAATDEVIVASSTPAESDPLVRAPEPTASESPDLAPTTDSVLSSSWPSPAPSSQVNPWASYGEASDVPDAGGSTADPQRDESEPDGAAGTAEEIDVTEESVVVAEPASQYEGWSAVVVEDEAPSADAGPPIARATALIDELRMLLPTLNAATTTEVGQAVADELDTALAGGRQAADDREALRAALTEARDNPRDIQALVALSQQADAALTLIDDYDRLADVIQRAINALRPDNSNG